MAKKKITGHCLVRNEEHWTWFAIMSVIDHLDRLLVYDTGSTDATLEIIKTIENKKLSFEKKGPITPQEFPQVRQEMLEKTDSDWVFLLDGDEVWPQWAIKKVVKAMNESEGVESIVVKTKNLVGDIYHYQEEAAGRYQIHGRRGHYNLRAFRKDIPGLHAAMPHGKQGYFDGSGKLIQARSREKIAILDDVYYLHLTHLSRSSKDAEVPLRKKKFKYELGKAFPKDFSYPEVFYLEPPANVPSPWSRRAKGYFLRAAIQTPFKKLKRRLSFRG